MDPRHRDVQAVARQREVPRRAERAGRAAARGAELATVAREGAHGTGRKGDGADGVVAGVGDVERIVAEGESLRISKSGSVTIDERWCTGADDALDAHAAPIILEVAHEHAMMGRVGDRDTIAMDSDLAGKSEALRGNGGRVRNEVHRLLAQGTTRASLL